MIFSSLDFLLFLTIVVALYYALGSVRGKSYILPMLVLASLVYYAYWNPVFLPVLICSLAANYMVATMMVSAGPRLRKTLFLVGLLGNLAALCYYKYADFFIYNINALLNTTIHPLGIVLPLGISFFTFQQVAFLSDIYTRRLHSVGGLQSYTLFISFFPQLVAGPIVHHAEMMPQFESYKQQQLNWMNMYNGLTMLCIGLAKKVLIADQLSPIVRISFDSGQSLSLLDAALGTLSYTLQLYYDFSGYSDMAIGCALFFNIRLPENFHSPYKAVNIKDFWKRWHITLSRWLQSYIYIPLGGNRSGHKRTIINITITFLLGGLWHGAAWTFVVWGAMHGAALALHRLWTSSGLRMPPILGVLCTFIFVNLAWVVFRATSFDAAARVYAGLSGVNGFGFSPAFSSAVTAQSFGGLCSLPGIGIFVLLALASCLLLPFSSSWLRHQEAPSLWRSVWIFSIGIASVIMISYPDRVSEFIYFQF